MGKCFEDGKTILADVFIRVSLYASRRKGSRTPRHIRVVVQPSICQNWNPSLGTGGISDSVKRSLVAKKKFDVMPGLRRGHSADYCFSMVDYVNEKRVGILSVVGMYTRCSRKMGVRLGRILGQGLASQGYVVSRVSRGGRCALQPTTASLHYRATDF